PSVGARGAAYGIPGFEVDGNDVLEIHRAAGEAMARARAGEGPTLLECKTYRTRAHAEGMGDFTYRTKDDVEAWKKRCPIARLRALAPTCGVAPGQLDAIDAEVAALVQGARQAAEAGPYPDAATATGHVYAEPRAAPALAAPGTRQITFAQATLEALDE